MSAEPFRWPEGVARIPDQDWVRQPLGELALKYDTVERHGWYDNLEPTLDQLQAYLRPGQILIDYSGGTGILVDRLLRRLPDLPIGIVIVDASPKFLALALKKLGSNPRVAFRWLEYIKAGHRLQRIEESVGEALVARGIDALASTNAIHLYYGLDETLASWQRVLRPGARAFIQSGNIQNPASPAGSWIIDETVSEIHRLAMEIVSTEERYAEYRPIQSDPHRMQQYDKLREKYFLPVRPLDHYLEALRRAGFQIDQVEARPIVARVGEWGDFLGAYHEGVLGWVGGSARIEGQRATQDAVVDRLALIRTALDRLFQGQDSFLACWTYIQASKG